MIEYRTLHGVYELYDNGMIGVKVIKQLFDTVRGVEVSSEPHRTVIDSGMSAAAQIAFVNEHLATMGYPPVADAEVLKLEAFRALIKRPTADFAGALSDTAKALAKENTALGVQLIATQAELAASEDQT